MVPTRFVDDDEEVDSFEADEGLFLSDGGGGGAAAAELLARLFSSVCSSLAACRPNGIPSNLFPVKSEAASGTGGVSD